MFQELEKAVELEPNKETYTLLGKAYLNRGMEDEAKDIAKKLKKFDKITLAPKRMKRRPRVVI